MKSALPKSEFARNVLTMMSGTTAAQLIPILLMPVLSRLYTAEEFGAFALFMGIVTVCSVIATGRYELAIVIPKSDIESLNLLSLSFILCSGFSFLLLLFAPIVDAFLIANPKHQAFSKLVYFIPLSVWFLSLYQILINWCNRQKQYSILALGSVFYQLGTGLSRIFFGVKSLLLLANGLIIGVLCGQFLVVCYVLRRVLALDRDLIHEFSKFNIITLLKKYDKFPKFNVPTSLISTFSRDFIIYLFSGFAMLEAAGHFAFARGIITVPITFLSLSLGQVFYQESAIAFGTERLESLLRRIILSLTYSFLPFFVFFSFWAPELFTFVFGMEWTVAGEYSAIYAPGAFLFLYISWTNRIFEVAGKQNVMFYIQLLSDILIVCLLWLALKNGASAHEAIAIYTVCFSIYNFIFLYFVFKVGNFQLRILRDLVKNLFFITFVLTVLFGAFLILFGKSILAFSLGLVVLLVYYGTLGYWYFKRNNSKVNVSFLVSTVSKSE